MNTSTKVVFLSRHTADALMLQQLSEKLGAEFELVQYKGTFSKFSGGDNKITFTEMLKEEDGTTSIHEREVPADAFIIAVAPPQVQIAILNSIKFSGGKATLLQPLTNRVSADDGSVSFQFVGLNEVHKVEIVTSTFSGGVLAPAHERR